MKMQTRVEPISTVDERCVSTQIARNSYLPCSLSGAGVSARQRKQTGVISNGHYISLLTHFQAGYPITYISDIFKSKLQHLFHYLSQIIADSINLFFSYHLSLCYKIAYIYIFYIIMQKNIHQEDLSVHLWMFSCSQMVQLKPPPPRPPTFTQSSTPSSLYSSLLAYWRDNGCKLMKPLRALVTQGRVGTQTLHHAQMLINQACSLPSGCPTQSQCVCLDPSPSATHPDSFL